MPRFAARVWLAGNSGVEVSPKVAGQAPSPVRSVIVEELSRLYAARLAFSWLESSVGIESC